MKKHMFYPIWKLDVLETELAQMERQGWRLCKLFGMCGYEFAHSQPKEAQYLVTYTVARGMPLLWQHMYEIEYTAKSRIGANPVDERSVFGSLQAFRITHTADLRAIKRERDRCLQGIVCYNMLLMLFLTILSVCTFVALCVRAASWFEIAFAGAFVTFYFPAAVYYFVAWCLIKRKTRRENI